jgi:hypothetical protein
MRIVGTKPDAQRLLDVEDAHQFPASNSARRCSPQRANDPARLCKEPLILELANADRNGPTSRLRLRAAHNSSPGREIAGMVVNPVRRSTVALRAAPDKSEHGESRGDYPGTTSINKPSSNVLPHGVRWVVTRRKM